jgi:RNA polymerase sigma-70 factor, ECF subfamily
MHPAEPTRRPRSARQVHTLNGGAAWDSFYDRTSPFVFGVLLRILGTRREAERLLERIYRDAAGAWRAVPETQRQSWILRRGREAAIGTLRLDRRAGASSEGRSAGCDRTADGPPQEPDSTVVPLSRLARSRLQARAALARLEPMDREMLEWAYFGGLSARAIAARSGLAEGEVRQRLRAALFRLSARSSLLTREAKS